MSQNTIKINHENSELQLPFRKVHSLVIGSGAAGLNAAVQLHANGIEDVLIITEGLHMGTSINTGSDKQTYYKLGLYGNDNDSPLALAESFFSGGSMHGNLALVEASLSARAFLNLVNLGVPFPTDEYGQFIGYKTDHDPLQRATSVGPYTSKMMCEVLIAEVERRNINVLEDRNAVSLLITEHNGEKRAAGAIVMNSEDKTITPQNAMEVIAAENVIFATGGPGGLYETSVYPNVHTGAIGLALLAGAKAQSLPESQYGMASTKFRWNVSGTYMQVIPRFISTAADGTSNVQEFLRPYFPSTGKMNSAIFLKGYQWPFDPRKINGGSSLVDILVYIETVLKGRRVFLDYTSNCQDFDVNDLDHEALDYLKNSDALTGLPIDRLRKMNPQAIKLYEEHGIHLVNEPLEIAVCAQHNNGGLAGNSWWESTNIKHLFPIGEVNGSHGVYRPGGSALNSGQVAGFRAAEYIAKKYSEPTADSDEIKELAAQEASKLLSWLKTAKSATTTWQDSRREFQKRISQFGAHIRSASQLTTALPEAWQQWQQLRDQGCNYTTLDDAVESLRNIQLCFAHAVYLGSIQYAIESGVGSRGSALVLEKDGEAVHDALPPDWTFALENQDFQSKVQETSATPDGTVTNSWTERTPLPSCNAWFEKAWAAYQAGKIYS